MKAKGRYCLFVVVCLFLSLSLGDISSASFCPTQLLSRKGIMPPSAFYYLGDLNSLLQDSTRQAFGQWNETLYNSVPCAGLTFYESTSLFTDVIHVTNANPLPGVNIPANAAAETITGSVDANNYPHSIQIVYKYPSDQISSDPAYIGSFYSGVQKFGEHEIGHVLSLADQQEPFTDGQSIMNGGNGVNDMYNRLPNAPTTCDLPNLQNIAYTCPCQNGEYSPHTECSSGTCTNTNTCGVNSCDPNENCGYCDLPSCPDNSFWDGNMCCCASIDDPTICVSSPILIDVSGNGFHLTDAAGGVNFDLDSNGVRERLGWTAPGSDNAFLALDRNGNGVIDNGQELFGNFTPQPQTKSCQRNGFNALKVFDQPDQGGNNDGVIDAQDAIFAQLRLWKDSNHNGVSEPWEIHTLPELGLAVIDLDYKESKRIDEYGNWFKYRARIRDAQGAQLGRWAWDVFLVRGR